MALVVLLGGARSGKSRLATDLVSRRRRPIVVIATGEARDEEMAERIARHRAERPPEWTTIEEPLDLCDALDKAPSDADVIIDCLTLWASNLMLHELSEAEIVWRARDAAITAAKRSSLVVAVSNEVGSGVIPSSALGRRFRDALGRVNTEWTNVADRSVLVVAGRVVPLEDAGALLDD